MAAPCDELTANTIIISSYNVDQLDLRHWHRTISEGGRNKRCSCFQTGLVLQVFGRAVTLAARSLYCISWNSILAGDGP